jgi:hypothetical protein
VTGWYPMDKFAPGDGDDTAVTDTEECIHPGIECERNSGEDACPCRCPECAENELDDDYDEYDDEDLSDMSASELADMHIEETKRSRDYRSKEEPNT